MRRARRATSVAFWLLIGGAGPISASVKLLVIQGRPVVDGVFVNSHGPYRFLIDTATTSNHIEPELARSIGLVATYRTELVSSVGKIQVAGSNEVDVELGDARVRNQNFLFAGMDVVHQLASGIRGILGQEFLAHFDYMLDMRGRRLDFGTQEPAGQRSAFRLASGRAAVSTNLGDLLLDSGATNVVLFGVEPASPDNSFIRTLAGTQVVGMVYRRLVIEGRRIWSGDAVAIPKSREPGVDGLLPLSLFHAVYVSNSERYAIFQ